MVTTTSMDAGANVLGARSLTRFMATSLPASVTPQLSTPYDAVALLSHSILLAVGFRLVGLGEEHRIEQAGGDQDSRASDDAVTNRKLPETWKDQSPNYAFRYKHIQSSMDYLLKVSRMGSKAVIMGMGMDADQTASFEIKVDDYISPSSLPLNIENDSASDTSDESSLVVAIRSIFISEGRIADYGANMRINIIQKLLPSLQKEGYQEDAQAGSNDQSSRPRDQQPQNPATDPSRPRNPYNPDSTNDPLLAQPRRFAPTGDMVPPGFEDPYDLHRPPRPLGGVGGTPGFGNIGHNDLYPPGMGPNDPLRAPGLGGLRQPGTGGGMHPSFDDPIFRNQGGGLPGAEGYDLRAPPGARYDPVGPGDAPRGAGGRPGGGFGGRGGMGGMGGPPNPFNQFGGDDFI